MYFLLVIWNIYPYLDINFHYTKDWRIQRILLISIKKPNLYNLIGYNVSDIILKLKEGEKDTLIAIENPDDVYNIISHLIQDS